MSSFDLVSKLTSVVKTEIDKRKISLSTYCKTRIQHLIKMGVERMAVSRASRNQEMVFLAENNIKHLVECLTVKAKTNGSFPNVGDNTLETVIDECYPLWPYN
jgi:hypothetical protein